VQNTVNWADMSGHKPDTPITRPSQISLTAPGTALCFLQQYAPSIKSVNSPCAMYGVTQSHPLTVNAIVLVSQIEPWVVLERVPTNTWLNTWLPSITTPRAPHFSKAV
jgi:hypothetical protein